MPALRFTTVRATRRDSGRQPRLASLDDKKADVCYIVQQYLTQASALFVNHNADYYDMGFVPQELHGSVAVMFPLQV